MVSPVGRAYGLMFRHMRGLVKSELLWKRKTPPAVPGAPFAGGGRMSAQAQACAIRSRFSICRSTRYSDTQKASEIWSIASPSFGHCADLFWRSQKLGSESAADGLSFCSFQSVDHGMPAFRKAHGIADCSGQPEIPGWHGIGRPPDAVQLGPGSLSYSRKKVCSLRAPSSKSAHRLPSASDTTAVHTHTSCRLPRRRACRTAG